MMKEETIIKGKTLQKIWDGLPEERKRRIHARAKVLEAEYLSLQELRQKAGITQANVSKVLKMEQGNVSRLEKNSDMLLSTLRKYIEAIGGKLNLIVELPNKPPIALGGIGDLLEDSKAEKIKL